MLLSLVNLEKSQLQIVKIRDFGSFWSYFCTINLQHQYSTKISQNHEFSRFELGISQVDQTKQHEGLGSE